jgi:lysine-ketoglutarate reductase/saccharopine dehydrogenase-like protein (TIGR00300 family)
VAAKPYEDVRVQGHLIDSLMVPQVMDHIMDLEGEFEVLSFEVGRTKTDTSTAVLRVFGRDRAHLEEILSTIQEHGAVAVTPEDADLAPAPVDGVFPDDFYSTTNLETFVRLQGEWVPVRQPEMDCGVRVDAERGTAVTVPLSDVRRGEQSVVGHHGVRVVPLERPRERQPFEFMASTVSSEKPKGQIVHEVARLLCRVKDEGKLTIAVAGPAVVHTGAAHDLARLVEMGHVGVVFGGNAVATHDIESAFFDTSLGINLTVGESVEGGHEHHLRAINRIRAAGGIKEAIDKGVLTKGLFYEIVRKGIPYVLAGSIRDDGPLPDVITDTMVAQQRMREYVRDAGLCLMLCSMLHSIATGNLLAASVHTVCVDINPAAVTKLADRGSFQTIGIVTDVGLFLDELVTELEDQDEACKEGSV